MARDGRLTPHALTSSPSRPRPPHTCGHGLDDGARACQTYAYHRLNAYTQWAEGEDEQVEVNQRALIDKVLARYAAEFTGPSRARASRARPS
jgi:hypothetical protein